MAEHPSPHDKVRLLIDGTKLADSVSDGIRRYVSGLLRAMGNVAQQHPDWSVDVHVGSRIIPLAEIDPWLKVPQRLPGTALRFLRETANGIRLQLQTRATEYDLIHLTMPNTFAAFRKFKGPRLVTIFDFSHLACPQWQAATNSRTLQLGLSDAIARDAAFTAVSEFTEREFVSRFGITACSVTGAGCDRSRFHPNYSAETRQAIREKYSLPASPFLLSVGTLEPRKNLIGTVQAFRRLLASNSDTALELVIVGRYGWGNLDDARNAADGCDRIHWLGYVPDQDLPLIYCQAEALSYVSHYEGFGLPALESMNCGVPVIYGADTAVAEVVADAGWAADANSIEQIYECFHEVATQPDSREERSQKAMLRSEKFDWARVAESMWETYTAVANRRLQRSAG
mgnify:CR=1 FL=1